MGKEFKVISKEYVPSWRNPVTILKRNRLEKAEKTIRVLMWLSLLFCVFATLAPPPDGDYAVPISFLFAAWEWQGIAVFATVGFTLLVALSSMVLTRHYFGLTLMSVAMISMVMVSTTNPKSSNHFGFFALLCGCIAAWLAVLGTEHQERTMQIASTTILISPIFMGAMGIAERIVICAAMAGTQAYCRNHVWAAWH